MAILFSVDELKAQRESVWNQYDMAMSSSYALIIEFPQAAAKRRLEAELLRMAVQSLDILITNAHWIEQGLILRMQEKRR
jgi:hypothetical protein